MSHEETYQSLSRPQQPVHAKFIAGEVEATGISYDNYDRMHTVTHKLNSGRSGPAPAWAFNDTQLRAIVVRATEHRAHYGKLGKRMGTTHLPGTEAERLAAAQKLLSSHRQSLIASIERLCKEYVAAKNRGDVARVDFLAPKIEELDTSLRVLDHAPKVLAGVVYYYYRCGLNSVEVAQQLGLKPPHIRALVWRLNRTAGELGYGPRKVVQRRRHNPERARSSRFASLLYGNPNKTWAQAKAEMGEPDAHNGQFRRLMQKYGLWKPRYYAPHHYIDTNKAAGLRAEGMSYTEIGKRYGLRNGTIQTILRRAGKDTPTRFKQSLHRGRVDYVEAKRLREEGWTFDQIGARFGVGASAILNGFKYRQKKAATAKDSRATVGQAPPCADAS